jgi:hypothetical protein
MPVNRPELRSMMLSLLEIHEMLPDFSVIASECSGQRSS